VAYRQTVRRIQNVLNQNPATSGCKCEVDEDCAEPGKLICDHPNLTFWRIHFDPCMCDRTGNAALARCDCVIFAFDNMNPKQAMFVVELKETYNKNGLSHIKEKLQNSIDIMQRILGGHMTNIEVYPILNDEKHSPLVAAAAQTQRYQIRCYGKSKSIILSKLTNNLANYYLRE
jgi:hypothetical protein